MSSRRVDIRYVIFFIYNIFIAQLGRHGLPQNQLHRCRRILEPGTCPYFTVKWYMINIIVIECSSQFACSSEARASQQSAKKKSTKISKPSSSKKESSDSKPEQTSLSSEAQLKSRRRRADTSGYIRRRFLYDEDDDNSKEKAAKSKTSKSQKRVSSHETKYRTSPLALMAASSANYQRKRKKNTDRSPSPVLSRSPRGRRGRRPKVFSPQLEGYSEDNMSNYDVEASEDEEFSEGIEGRIPESYSHRRPRVEYDENTQLIKPVFRRIQKRDSYRTEGAFSSESHQVRSGFYFMSNLKSYV